MIDVYTVSMIKEAEKTVIDGGIAETELISHAGRALQNSYDFSGKKVAVVCGGGKNGGDGMAFSLGIDADVYITGGKMCPETEQFYEKVKKLRNVRTLDGKVDFGAYDVIVDCIFGVGLSRKVEGVYSDVIRAINGAEAFVISADIPSGLDADTGRIMGEAVRADMTVSFSPMKSGFLLNDGSDICGKIVFADMPIPYKESFIKLMGYSDVHIEKRKHNTHKGTYGKVTIIAGSPRYTGAALLSTESCRAALRSGAGLVNLAVPYSMREVYQKRVTETVLTFLPDDDGKLIFDKYVLDRLIGSSDVIAIGMGLGNSPELFRIVSYLIENCPKLLIDADGINCLAGRADVLKRAKGEVYLTPHPKEFSRLFGIEVGDINTVYSPLYMSREYGVKIHLKGAASVSVDNGGVIITNEGGAELAKAGSGDVLSGIMAAMIAQKIEYPMATASILHGRAGKAAMVGREEFSVLASDLSNFVGRLL